jgi:hypothetical protein
VGRELERDPPLSLSAVTVGACSRTALMRPLSDETCTGTGEVGQVDRAVVGVDVDRAAQTRDLDPAVVVADDDVRSRGTEIS